MSYHDDMERVPCCVCGEMFYRDASEYWKKMCLDCYVSKKKEEERKDKEEYRIITNLRRENHFLKEQLKNKQKIPVLDKITIKGLISLCHPDLHGNSQKSNDVTKWLIGLYKDA